MVGQSFARRRKEPFVSHVVRIYTMGTMEASLLLSPGKGKSAGINWRKVGMNCHKTSIANWPDIELYAKVHCLQCSRWQHSVIFEESRPPVYL